MDRKNLFPIGEVSKLFHISVSSLRHYEHIGLLTPEYISSDSGYRYYGTEQFEVLNTIRYLRRMTPKAIRQITTDSSEPAAVASPIGRSVAGNNFEVT